MVNMLIRKAGPGRSSPSEKNTNQYLQSPGGDPCLLKVLCSQNRRTQQNISSQVALLVSHENSLLPPGGGCLLAVRPFLAEKSTVTKQVPGWRGKTQSVWSQVEIKAGSPLSIPQHRLHHLQSAGGMLLRQCSRVTITCQETAHQHQLGDKSSHSWFQGQRLMYPVKRCKSPLEVSGQDPISAGVPEAAVDAAIRVPAGREVTARLCIRLQIHPQPLLTVWGQGDTQRIK
ncbi:hypothetical protein EYF80_023193 [Liparis tanakae]|uniref:Uncharacterized protein n=1 Tax=Liparis tanakae TaxID=230148 RepID=A0A4Z2HL79_9TELE|nr:hypothetical protein EYF80_023193 [Liparis tanakae]